MTNHDISLSSFFGVVRNQIKFILVIMCVSFALAGIYCAMTPNIYRGEQDYRIQSAVTPRELVEVLGRLDQGKFEQIFSNPHSIKRVTVTPYREAKDKVKILIESEDLSTLPRAFSELIVYLKNMPLMVKSWQTYLEEINVQYQAINANMKKIDKIMAEAEGSGKRIYVTNPLDVYLKYQEILLLKHRLEMMHNSQDSIEMLSQASVSNTPIAPRKLFVFSLAGAMGLFFSIFISFYLQYRIQRKQP